MYEEDEDADNTDTVDWKLVDDILSIFPYYDENRDEKIAQAVRLMRIL